LKLSAILGCVTADDFFPLPYDLLPTMASDDEDYRDAADVQKPVNLQIIDEVLSSAYYAVLTGKTDDEIQIH